MPLIWPSHGSTSETLLDPQVLNLTNSLCDQSLFEPKDLSAIFYCRSKKLQMYHTCQAGLFFSLRIHKTSRIFQSGGAVKTCCSGIENVSIFISPFILASVETIRKHKVDTEFLLASPVILESKSFCHFPIYIYLTMRLQRQRHTNTHSHSIPSPLYDNRLLTPPSSAGIQKRCKHIHLLTWSVLDAAHCDI